MGTACPLPAAPPLGIRLPLRLRKAQARQLPGGRQPQARSLPSHVSTQRLWGLGVTDSVREPASAGSPSWPCRLPHRLTRTLT